MPPVIVVRSPNWLGDTVMALPALRALRDAEPDARVAVVGRWAGLLAGQGVADLLLDYPADRRRRRRLARRLAQDPPDLALLLPNSFESALSALRWRARRRVGFANDARAILLTDAVPLPAPRLHQTDEYRLLVRAVAGESGCDEPRWVRHPPEGAEDEVSELMAGAGLPRSARLVGLHLGVASGPAKRWAAARWAALSDALATAGIVPVLLGGAADVPAAEAAIAAARFRPASLAGRDRPALLPALVARLACLVSGDTGLAHLAAALGVPTVTLFGPTDPRLTAPRSARARVVAVGAPCAPCFRDTCPIDHPCMNGISVEMVAGQVKEALAG
jgi:heptosyltransferase-2